MNRMPTDEEEEIALGREREAKWFESQRAAWEGGHTREIRARENQRLTDGPRSMPPRSRSRNRPYKDRLWMKPLQDHNRPELVRPATAPAMSRDILSILTASGTHFSHDLASRVRPCNKAWASALNKAIVSRVYPICDSPACAELQLTSISMDQIKFTVAGGDELSILACVLGTESPQVLNAQFPSDFFRLEAGLWVAWEVHPLGPALMR